VLVFVNLKGFHELVQNYFVERYKKYRKMFFPEQFLIDKELLLADLGKSVVICVIDLSFKLTFRWQIVERVLFFV